jgi:hypothetical protein
MFFPFSQVVIPFGIQRYSHVTVPALHTRRSKDLCRRIINKLEFPLCRSDAAARTVYVSSDYSRLKTNASTRMSLTWNQNIVFDVPSSD